ERARVVAAEKFDSGVAMDRLAEIADDAVDRHRHTAFRKRRRYRTGDFGAGGPGRELALRAVGKGDGNHSLLLLTRRYQSGVSRRDRTAPYPACGSDIAAGRHRDKLKFG